jgi:hypothetical protein
MSSAITAVVAASAISAGVSAYSGHQSRKAAKSAADRLNSWEYLEDPDFTDTQAKLKELGLGLLDGDIPDYYKAIGETGSEEFEKALALTNRDISQSAAEASAAAGRSRGGNLPAVTAQAIADSAIKARYDDYNRSLVGKESLLNKGISVTEGVRAAAFGEQTAKNQIEAQKVGGMIDLDFFKADAASQEMAGYGSALSSLIGGISGGISGGGTTGSISDAALAKNKTQGVSQLGSISGTMGKSNPNLYDKMFGL